MSESKVPPPARVRLHHRVVSETTPEATHARPMCTTRVWVTLAILFAANIILRVTGLSPAPPNPSARTTAGQQAAAATVTTGPR
jgi:hypothetical protein